MEMIGLVVMFLIGAGAGTMYERKKWQKATGKNRADQ